MTLRIDILTLFPAMFAGPFEESIIKRARLAGIVDIAVSDLRTWARGRHRTADDRPFGGGPGMVLKANVVFEAVEALVPDMSLVTASNPSFSHPAQTRIILADPQGRQFDQAAASDLATENHLVLICGHYEGIDERVKTHLATDAYSIGDFVLTGGELPVMLMVDAIVRLLPHSLGRAESAAADTFSTGLLDHPHYTRPAEFRGWRVPEVLLSGDHRKIARWRRTQSLLGTLQLRPDLLAKAKMTPKERHWLASFDLKDAEKGVTGSKVECLGP